MDVLRNMLIFAASFLPVTYKVTGRGGQLAIQSLAKYREAKKEKDEAAIRFL